MIKFLRDNFCSLRIGRLTQGLIDLSQYSHPVLLILLYLLEDLRELRLCIIRKRRRFIELEDVSIGENHDFVTLHDSVEAVSDRDECAFVELCLQQLLNLLLSHNVYVGSGLV